MGGADEAIPPEDVAEFEQALERAGVEHEVVTYDGAPHSFFDRKHEDVRRRRRRTRGSASSRSSSGTLSVRQEPPAAPRASARSPAARPGGGS